MNTSLLIALETFHKNTSVCFYIKIDYENPSANRVIISITNQHPDPSISKLVSNFLEKKIEARYPTGTTNTFESFYLLENQKKYSDLIKLISQMTQSGYWEVYKLESFVLNDSIFVPLFPDHRECFLGKEKIKNLLYLSQPSTDFKISAIETHPALIKYKYLSILEKILTTEFNLWGGGKALKRSPFMPTKKIVPHALAEIYSVVESTYFYGQHSQSQFKAMYEYIKTILKEKLQPSSSFFKTGWNKQTIQFYKDLMEGLENFNKFLSRTLPNEIISITNFPDVIYNMITDYYNPEHMLSLKL